MENVAKVGDNSGATDGVQTVESPLTTDAVGARDTMATVDSIPGKSPAFQFYPNDFTSGTADLPAEDVGVYVRLLCHQWNKGAIPSDVAAIGRIGGVSPGKMRAIWARLKRHFVAGKNPRLEREREKQANFHRRQSDAAKKRWDKPQPSQDDASAGNAAALPAKADPGESPSVFSLQTSVKRKAGEDGRDPKIAAIASELQEIYPEVYAAARAGAVYRTTQATQDRDGPKYYAAAEMHPDIGRLRALLELFLTRSLGEKSSPGTPGQFVHMLPECDEVLRRSGWKATA